MKFDSAKDGWEPETMELVKKILDSAHVQQIDVIIELFSPARKCRCCNSESIVFVRPQGLCATCWRRFCLPFTLSGVRDLHAPQAPRNVFLPHQTSSNTALSKVRSAGK
jgi:hypothetical protein